MNRQFLRNIADIQTGPFGSQLHKEDYVDVGTPIVTVEHLGNRVFTEQNLPKVSDKDKIRLSKYILKEGDMVFSRVGSVDRCSYVDAAHDGWMFSGRCLRVRPNAEIVPLYLYYFFCLEDTKQFVRNIAVGATMPSINTKLLGEVEVTYPSLTEQQKIVALLSALDDKIETNQKVNDNLEQQAVVLFRAWFSTFSLFPSSPRINSEFGEIPEDFAVVKVGSLPMLVTDYVANGSFASLKANVNLYQEPNYAYFIRNTDLKSGSFGVYVDQHSYEFLSKSTLYGGEIIISNVGDVGSVFLCPKLDGRMTLGNNIIMLRPEDDHLRYYLYIWFKYLQGQALIQGIKGGSAQPKFNKTDFKNTSVLIPPKDILTRFHEIVSPMFETISQRQAENTRLADLRDTLMPQLMSGEIDVSALDL